MFKIFQSKKSLVLSLIFLVLLIFWLLINLFDVFRDSELSSAKTLFTNTYGIVALTGGLFAIYISKKWGGYKSLIGRSILLFGLGLLAQEFGQLMYAYYIYIEHIEVPYPSLGDIGYFGSVLMYITAIYTLFKASGSKFSLINTSAKLQLYLLPPVILIVSYVIFLRGYVFSNTPLLTIILDFGYPLLQATYLSIAILVLTLSRKYLGGLMRPVILLVLFSLVIQYVADFSFLYQVKHDTWAPGGINDLIYLISYFMMALSLIGFGAVYQETRKKLTHGHNSESTTT